MGTPGDRTAASDPALPRRSTPWPHADWSVPDGRPSVDAARSSVALGAAAFLHLLHGLLDPGLVLRLACLVEELLGDAESCDLLCHTHVRTVPSGGRTIRRGRAR